MSNPSCPSGCLVELLRLRRSVAGLEPIRCWSLPYSVASVEAKLLPENPPTTLFAPFFSAGTHGLFSVARSVAEHSMPARPLPVLSSIRGALPLPVRANCRACLRHWREGARWLSISSPPCVEPESSQALTPTICGPATRCPLRLFHRFRLSLRPRPEELAA